MGISNEDQEQRCVAKQESEENTERVFIISLLSFLASITGALILAFWDYKYHSTYSQLWLVPTGLILLTTPPVIWLAVWVSEICNPKDDDFSGASQSTNSLGNSVHTGEVIKEVAV